MDVLMPQLGETVAEGKITKWYKSAGEAVQPGDNLFEIETDKTSMEVPATAAGVLAEIRVGEGEVVPVGAVVAVIFDAADANVNARPALKGPQAVAPAAPGGALRRAAPIKLDPFFEVRTPTRNYGSARLTGGASITPLARRFAAEAGIDVGRVRGSGPHGRIFARDVKATGQSAHKAATIAEGPIADQVKALYEPGSYEEVPLDGMRATIAARLVHAKQTIPHFYLTADIDIDQLLKLREEANAAAPKDRDGNAKFKLSLNDLIIKAWAAALQHVPAANAVWAGDRILKLRHSDIGVAVAVEGGLFTPIIRKAETKSLSMISAEMKELSEHARARRLKPSDYQGGSSVVSNLGMYGVREFAAIINPPHATVLAVGAARRHAVEKQGGGVAFVTQVAVTLSCDHRVVDGALGAELIGIFRGLIEKPVTALA
jgi:pyruvate dehydrogenase E2 component (dihydrolipoamide acetyltransferase)